MLSRHEKNQSFKKALEDLARGEQSHYEFWKAYTPDTAVKVNRLKVYFTLLLRLTLGLTFTMKFLERHEDALHERYRQMVKNIPPADKARCEAMMEEEEHQETYLMGEIHEGRVKYRSFIVLGLAGAVVEISGIHAGSLGILNRFFFSSRRRHTRFDCDWSSHVCSSDLALLEAGRAACRLRRTLFHSLSSSWVWWASSLSTSRVPSRAAMRSRKSALSSTWGRGLRPS